MINNYKLYKQSWICSKDPHREKELSQELVSQLFNLGGVIVRNTYCYILLRIFHKIEFSVGHKSFPEVIIEPAYLQYLQESCNDATSDTGHNMLLPNECLFKGLGLKFSDNHGGWVNEKDELIAFDNSVYTEGHSALLVRKDVLLEYLSKEG